MKNLENSITKQSEINRLNALVKTGRNQINQLTTTVLGLENTIKQLKEEVAIDPLTGLCRRNYFEKRVTEEFSKLRESNQEKRKEGGIEHITMLFIDIDNFKKFNDDHGGHEKGDQMLQMVAQILRENVRQSDIVCRWGGEEMVVSLIGTNEADAAQKAEELKTVIQKKSACTVSIGVAAFEQNITPHELIHQADIAMYKAKNTGKNRVELFSQFTQEDHAKYGKTPR